MRGWKTKTGGISGQKTGTEDSNTKKFDIAGSAKPVPLYSLDAIISVGYRVNSKAATRFRQCATRTIKAFIMVERIMAATVARRRTPRIAKYDTVFMPDVPVLEELKEEAFRGGNPCSSRLWL